VVEQIKTFLATNLNVPKHLDGEAVLNAIAVQQGILVERAEDVYSFSHLTLQEYLTAQYVADNNLIEQLVNCHLFHPRWREVFLLVAGLVRSKNGADDLLLLMEKEAQKYINTPKLKGLLQWADAATKDSEGDFKLVGKRASAISFANASANASPNAIVYVQAYHADAIAKASGIVFAIPYANAIGNTNAIPYDYAMANTIYIAKAIVLAEKLQEIKIFKDVNWTEFIAQLKKLEKQLRNTNLAEQVLLALFSDRLLDTWCNALHLNPEIVKLSEEEAKALEDYLSANHLIIQCKEAAVRISAKTWEEIESRMLLVPENSTL
jgi:hypothetical protein